MYRAFDARGRRKVQLARKALELSPDRADADVVLAEEATDPETARNLYEQGVAAGERALGPTMFEEEAGHSWGLTTSRPYMRARLGLAQCLDASGRSDEAIGHYRDLLPDSYALGSVEEALLCADGLGEAWRATPGALRWLATAKPKTKPKKRRRC